MNVKEKPLPRLVDVYHASSPLSRRQLPLVVDENLTLVMDVKKSGIVCDNPPVRGKELDEFVRKFESLTDNELHAALQITKSELMNVLNQNVPCVGCRRSVERLYYQLFKFGHPTLDPLRVESDGTITIREVKHGMAHVLCSTFHEHSIRLANLIENQPKRSKKSVRCLLHSLDSQRTRPLTPVWRDVWACMKSECKKNVCRIEASTLHATLETYLRKHRFCGECRTKVLRAYYVLVEEDEPCKDKGYVSSLYAGIRKCLKNKHIHLQTKTDYITKLIGRAEPELLGSRRERHAKTLEIAQEEVLTCLGICMYERLHRIYMRMREEECTCQVFAAVAVDTLSRSFETAVERKQGVSQLDLYYAELTREEHEKHVRKEQKKIKRRRKKGKGAEADGKENCGSCDNDNDEDYDDKDDPITDKDCSCVRSNDGGVGRYNCDFSLEDDIWTSDCKCDADKEEKGGTFKCKRGIGGGGGDYLGVVFKGQNGNSSDHSHDCGYSSENNNGCCETGSLISSISSSPEGSELACSDGCCQNDSDCATHNRLTSVQHLSLQEMLEGCSDDEDDSICKLTPEEVSEFENNNKHLFEKRQELRESLKKKFINFCVYGPLQVPRLLVQTKYASN